MKKKEDLRVVKTKNLLYSTLLELLKEKPFEEIKVSDICDKALINRSTFYSHYADKYELFVSCVENLKSSLTKELEKNKNIHSFKEYYLEMIRIFLNHIEEQKEVYTAIMRNNKNSIMMDMVYNAFKQDIEKTLEQGNKNNKNTIPSNFIVQFYLGAVFGIGMEMLTNPKEYSKKQIIDYLEVLIPEDPYIKRDRI